MEKSQGKNNGLISPLWGPLFTLIINSKFNIMTTEDIIEGNKLIAEFMGAKYNQEAGFYLRPNEVFIINHGICDYTTIELGKGKVLHYNSSWYWLMDVVDKIEKLYRDKVANFTVVIKGFCCEIEQSPYHANAFKEVHFAEIYVTEKTKIGAVYTAVLEFIKWYNQNNI